MFDIGFSELLVIGVVALIVIGPERLPRVARTLGHLFGRMQRYVNEVKSDIQREIELDELRKLRESVEQSAREIEQSVSREIHHAGDEMREIEALIDPRPEGAGGPEKTEAKSPEPDSAPGEAHAKPQTEPVAASSGSAEPQPDPARASSQQAQPEPAVPATTSKSA